MTAARTDLTQYKAQLGNDYTGFVDRINKI